MALYVIATVEGIRAVRVVEPVAVVCVIQNAPPHVVPYVKPHVVQYVLPHVRMFVKMVVEMYVLVHVDFLAIPEISVLLNISLLIS